jgi:D-xylose transport system permease protein
MTSLSKSGRMARPFRWFGRRAELRVDANQVGTLDARGRGNPEAARRAGINVKRIYSGGFILCAMLAALGGVLSAARLASASQQAGTGDVNLNVIAAAVIGGTSLFGGRGSAFSALLGIIVIQSIASGLTLLDLSSSLRFMITGGVLAIAVIVDSLARQSRVSHGGA